MWKVLLMLLVMIGMIELLLEVWQVVLDMQVVVEFMLNLLNWVFRWQFIFRLQFLVFMKFVLWLLNFRLVMMLVIGLCWKCEQCVLIFDLQQFCRIWVGVLVMIVLLMWIFYQFSEVLKFWMKFGFQIRFRVLLVEVFGVSSGLDLEVNGIGVVFVDVFIGVLFWCSWWKVFVLVMLCV